MSTEPNASGQDPTRDVGGLPVNEQTPGYAGQALGRAAQGAFSATPTGTQTTPSTQDVITAPNIQDRSVVLGGQYIPSSQDLMSIAKANQLTGGGIQTMAGNLAINSAQGTGSGGGTFQANGSPSNPVLVTTPQEDYEAAKMILTETHGTLDEMIKIAEVLRNRTMAAQAGTAKKYGTPTAPTVTGQIYTPAQFSAYNGITGYAGGAGSNYLASATYNGSEPDFQKALKAWHIALAGSNLSYGATNFAQNTTWGGGVLTTGGAHMFSAPTGNVFNAPGLAAPGTMNGVAPTAAMSVQPGQYIQNNTKMNHAAQTMQSAGHQPTVAEASMLSLYPPNVVTAWANAHNKKKSHKTVKELIQDDPAWQIFASMFSGKISHPSLSPIELHKIWVHHYFRPHKNVGLQKWNLLQMMSGFISATGTSNLSSFLPPAMASAISAINNTWTNLGPDGPIAHGVQNVLANLFAPVPQPTSTYVGPPSPYPSNPSGSTSWQFTNSLGYPVTMAMHSEDILQNLSSVKSSQIIANLAFAGSTSSTYLFNIANAADMGTVVGGT